jgi:hypothetical protein
MGTSSSRSIVVVMFAVARDPAPLRGAVDRGLLATSAMRLSA